MLKTLTATHRLRHRANKVPCVSESAVRRAAEQLQFQFPGTPWLEASHRADRAYVAGHMYHFRLWGLVASALRGYCGNRLTAAS